VSALMIRRTSLANLSDERLLSLVQSLPAGCDDRNAACEQLVRRYDSLVRSCAQRYWRSPESQDELMQVGYLGLMKAINNFDASIGTSLAAYARPCISGELKRHFRDKRWQVRVKRSAQEGRLEVRRARDELTQRLARIPTDREIADHLAITDDELRDARQAELVFQTRSLDAPLSDGKDSEGLAELIGTDDPNLERHVDMETVWAHWDELGEREQQLLTMRFYGNMTQAEIGERLGISQMHVSRLLAAALAYLRDCLTGPDWCEAAQRLCRPGANDGGSQPALPGTSPFC
jgi:RNA polymerase sigma-B factor